MYCIFLILTLPSDGHPEESGWDPELEEAVKREKEELVNESMKKLEDGMQEAQVRLLSLYGLIVLYSI